MSDDRIELLRAAYLRFNHRDIDALLAMMTDDVEWPDAATGAVLHDTASVRAYWEGQFAVADPLVEPLDFLEAGADLIVAVDQRVADLDGNLLAPPTVVFHRYTFEGDRIRRMVIFADRDSALAG